MATLEVLSQKIDALKDTISQLTDSAMDEKEKIQAQIVLIEECERVVNNEELMSNYDFSNAIRLVETYNYSIENLSKIISDIQSVFLVRRELNMSDIEMPLEDVQASTFKTFLEGLNKIKEELNNRLRQMSENVEGKSKISNLESLKNIFEGTGRRKYYTDEMFRDFYEEFDILSLPPEEAKNLLEGFYQTRNLSSRQSIERASFEDVLSLYKEFLPESFMTSFELLLGDHKNEVTSVIDLDNTREILQFFKDTGIITRFNKTSLLKISLYGKPNYIKDVVYPDIFRRKPKEIDTYFKDDLASVWIKENGTSKYKSSPFRRSRGRGEDKDKDSLYPSSHLVTLNEFDENVKILKANNDLFGDRFDFDEPGAYLNIKTLPVWVLKKNIELCRLFDMGIITFVPTTCLERGDIEDKLHLAVELGLLNPPLTPKYLEMDKSIVRYEEFQKATAKKRVYNQSIRNYFQRYLSVLSNRTINEYAVLFHKLQSQGQLSFYNDFFSDSSAGKGNRGIINGQDRAMISDKEQMDDFIANNFMTDWYSDFIDNYDEYDDIITEYNDFEKKEEYRESSYIDSTILDDPLIRELESENTVKDVVTQNEEIVEVTNKFVYMFGDTIISRYKVLHNAAILKEMYGALTKDMLMASIVRNSFLDENSFQQIQSIVMERGRTL